MAAKIAKLCPEQRIVLPIGRPFYVLFHMLLL